MLSLECLALLLSANAYVGHIRLERTSLFTEHASPAAVVLLIEAGCELSVASIRSAECSEPQRIAYLTAANWQRRRHFAAFNSDVMRARTDEALQAYHHQHHPIFAQLFGSQELLRFIVSFV